MLMLTCSTYLCIYRCMNNTDYMGGIIYHELDNVNIFFSFATAIYNYLNQSTIFWLCQPAIFTLTFLRSTPSTVCQSASAVDLIDLIGPQLFVNFVWTSGTLNFHQIMNPLVEPWWPFTPTLFPSTFDKFDHPLILDLVDLLRLVLQSI